MNEEKRQQNSAKLRRLLEPIQAHGGGFEALRGEFLAQAADYRQAAETRRAALKAKLVAVLEPYCHPGQAEALAGQTRAMVEADGRCAAFHDVDRHGCAATVEHLIEEREALSALPEV